MLIIEKGYNLWPGDVPWLLAQSIVMTYHGIPASDEQILYQNEAARRSLGSNCGGIIKE